MKRLRQDRSFSSWMRICFSFYSFIHPFTWFHFTSTHVKWKEKGKTLSKIPCKTFEPYRHWNWFSCWAGLLQLSGPQCSSDSKASRSNRIRKAVAVLFHSCARDSIIDCVCKMVRWSVGWPVTLFPRLWALFSHYCLCPNAWLAFSVFKHYPCSPTRPHATW